MASKVFSRDYMMGVFFFSDDEGKPWTNEYVVENGLYCWEVKKGTAERWVDVDDEC